MRCPTAISILVLFAVLGILDDSYGQQDVSTQENSRAVLSETTQIRLRDIKREVHRINSNTKKFKTKSTDVFGKSSEGGNVTGLFLNGELRKLVSKFYGASGNILCEYYFVHDTLIFLHKQETEYVGYDVGGDTVDTSIKSAVNEKYYFFQQRLILWLDGNEAPVNPLKYSYVEAELRILGNLMEDRTEIYEKDDSH